MVVIILLAIICFDDINKRKNEYPVQNILDSQFSKFEYYDEENDIFLLLTGSPHMDLRDYLACLQLNCTNKEITQTENWSFRILLNPTEYCPTCDELEILIGKDSIYVNGHEYKPEDLETYELAYDAVEQYYFYFKENYEGVVKKEIND